MGAADVVGLDLEAGYRVRVRALREEEVARLLEGVGLLRARIDSDHAAPDGGRTTAEHAAEGQVRGRVRSGVLLLGVEVEVLAPAAGIGARDLGVGPGAVKLRLH